MKVVVGPDLVDAKLAKKLKLRNYKLARKLYSEGEYYEWSVVVLFYSGLFIG